MVSNKTVGILLVSLLCWCCGLAASHSEVVYSTTSTTSSFHSILEENNETKLFNTRSTLSDCALCPSNGGNCTCAGSCPVSSSNYQDFYIRTTCPNGFFLSSLHLQCRTDVIGNYQVYLMSPNEYTVYKADSTKIPAIKFASNDCIDYSLTLEKDQTLVQYWLDLKPEVNSANWWFSLTGVCNEIKADLPVRMKIETSIITTYNNNPFDMSITLYDKNDVIAGNAMGKLKISLNSTLNPGSVLSNSYESIPSWGNVTFSSLKISSSLPQVVLDLVYTDGNYSISEKFTMNITGTEVGFLIVHPIHVITNQPFNVDFYGVDSNNRVVQSTSTGAVKIGTYDSSLPTENLYMFNSKSYIYLTKFGTNTQIRNGHGTLSLKSEIKGVKSFYLQLYITQELTIQGTGTVQVTYAPSEATIDLVEGLYGSGSNTTFTVTIYDGSFKYSTPSIVKAYNGVVRLVSTPPTIGFPMESMAKEGVATFKKVFITDPRTINVQISIDTTSLPNKDIKIGDSVKLSISMNTKTIVPGTNFWGNVSILDMYDNFLEMANGKTFFNISYNGNQFLKIDSKVVNGTCMFSSVSIPKIYSSPVYVQAGFYSQQNQWFLSDRIELAVYNMTINPQQSSVQPQLSIVKPQISNRPTPAKSMNNPTTPPTLKSNQRLNDTFSITPVGILFSFILIINLFL